MCGLLDPSDISYSILQEIHSKMTILKNWPIHQFFRDLAILQTKSVGVPLCCQGTERRVWRTIWHQFGVSTPNSELPVMYRTVFDPLVTFDLDLWPRTLRNNRHRDFIKLSSHTKFDYDSSKRFRVIALTKIMDKQTKWQTSPHRDRHGASPNCTKP